jgi:hypothetical protein
MINLKDAMEAGRYWNAMLEQHRAYTQVADRPALKAVARQRFAQLGHLLTRVQRDGVVAVENYWSAEQCTAAREELERLIRDYPGCVQPRSNGADLRMFGVEMAGKTSGEFHHDVFLKAFGEIAGGFELYNFATLGARIDATATNRGSGEGWHRDAFGFQFKAILYLCDVTDDNGPFEYIPGSHRRWRVVADTALGRIPVPPDSRIDDQKMDGLVARGIVRPKRFLARAGTLLLVNTSGIHRGAPLRAGTRYAMTNYYYHPYQLGRSMVEKFSPLFPGVLDRVAPFLEKEKLSSEPEKTENFPTV